MPDATTVKTQLDAYLQYWTTGNKAGWLSLFAPNAVLTDPVGTPPHEGIAAIEAFWDRVHQLPMTFHPTLNRIAICEDEALMLFKMISRPESGPGIAMEIGDTFRFNKEGLITELKAYWDSNSSQLVDAPNH